MMLKYRAYIYFVLLVLSGALLSEQGHLHSAYETLSLFASPDATRAVEYGQRHFKSSDPKSYDVDRAEYFFTKAISLDASNQKASHELARIRFLRGDFTSALSLINAAIQSDGKEPIPSSYYVRGLIEGFKGDNDAAEADFRTYLKHDPTNWAATNDLAWVLLKSNKPRDAMTSIDKVLSTWPNNPWLLNSYSIALHELGYDEEAHKYATRASNVAQSMTTEEWLKAYPGNDPKIAHVGLLSLKKAITDNMLSIENTL